jgi:ABC-type dipeptide/oligopeptide/nickel transport system permease component
MNKSGVMLSFLVKLILSVIITIIVLGFLVNLYKTVLPGQLNVNQATLDSFNQLVEGLNALNPSQSQNLALSFGSDYVIYARNKGDPENEYNQEVISKNALCKDWNCLCLYDTKVQKFIECKTVSNKLWGSGILISEAEDVKSYKIGLSGDTYTLS